MSNFLQDIESVLSKVHTDLTAEETKLKAWFSSMFSSHKSGNTLPPVPQAGVGVAATPGKVPTPVPIPVPAAPVKTPSQPSPNPNPAPPASAGGQAGSGAVTPQPVVPVSPATPIAPAAPITFPEGCTLSDSVNGYVKLAITGSYADHDFIINEVVELFAPGSDVRMRAAAQLDEADGKYLLGPSGANTGLADGPCYELAAVKNDTTGLVTYSIAQPVVAIPKTVACARLAFPTVASAIAWFNNK